MPNKTSLDALSGITTEKKGLQNAERLQKITSRLHQQVQTDSTSMHSFAQKIKMLGRIATNGVRTLEGEHEKVQIGNPLSLQNPQTESPQQQR